MAFFYCPDITHWVKQDRYHRSARLMNNIPYNLGLTKNEVISAPAW